MKICLGQAGDVFSTDADRLDPCVRAQSQNKCWKYCICLSDLGLKLRGNTQQGQFSSITSTVFQCTLFTLSRHQGAKLMRNQDKNQILSDQNPISPFMKKDLLQYFSLTTRKQGLWRPRNHNRHRDEATLKAHSLSKCSAILSTYYNAHSQSQLKTWDSCTASNQKHRANHNITFSVSSHS